MAKTTKGGRAMNPTDAARKQARKKEIARNKLERDLQRATPKDVSEISKRLEELIEEEEIEKARGKGISKSLHIRRKVLQDAMKLAVAKERETTMKQVFGCEGVKTTPYGHGVPQRRPEDSVYYHPITNPTGMPPPGRPQRYKDDVDLMDPTKADAAEAARRARIRAATETATALAASETVLPPPDYPPPGILPPPDGPPPGVSAVAQPAAMPPPAGPPPGILPPPTGLPLGMLPPPIGPPPNFASGAMPAPIGLTGSITAPPPPVGAVSAAPQVKPVETVMHGEATAKKPVPANQDPTLTCMIPATVRARRPKVKPSAKFPVLAPKRDESSGFGLVPSAEAHSMGMPDTTFETFMSEIANL